MIVHDKATAFTNSKTSCCLPDWSIFKRMVTNLPLTTTSRYTTKTSCVIGLWSYADRVHVQYLVNLLCGTWLKRWLKIASRTMPMCSASPLKSKQGQLFHILWQFRGILAFIVFGLSNMDFAHFGRWAVPLKIRSHAPSTRNYILQQHTHGDKTKMTFKLILY